IMQPVPGYAYDLQYHLWTKTLEGLGAWGRSHWGYPIWEAKAETEKWSENFLNLTHMAEDFTWNIWVDPVHYTRGFNEQLAQKISDEIVSRDWLEK
ncbi:MAG: hypothetical protein K8I82_05025, partial [Anaerolineae bacterium]|nr:hypothetical protein [Anaerolineae bacterium]